MISERRRERIENAPQGGGLSPQFRVQEEGRASPSVAAKGRERGTRNEPVLPGETAAIRPRRIKPSRIWAGISLVKFSPGPEGAPRPRYSPLQSGSARLDHIFPRRTGACFSSICSHEPVRLGASCPAPRLCVRSVGAM